MPANIVHLVGQLGRGGAEKQLFLLASALNRRGWQQAVISFLPGGTWASRFVEQGIPVSSIPRTRITPWRFWQLRRLIRSEKPHIIVSWSAHAGVYADWLFGIGRVARVFNVRGDLTRDVNSCAPKRRFRLLQVALEGADCVVGNSKQNLDLLREAGVVLPRTEVIGNIVAEGATSAADHVPRAARIVAVGSLIPRKSYDTLLEAAGILAAKAKNFELLLAGEGPERQRLESLASKLGISHLVRFLGDCDNIPELLARADIFAHPAISEGLCNAILEALAARLPVVACPTGATSELIEDGRNGLLVPIRQPQALARALDSLLNDASLRRRLAQAGSVLVRDRFSESTIADQYEAVFRRLIDGHS